MATKIGKRAAKELHPYAINVDTLLAAAGIDDILNKAEKEILQNLLCDIAALRKDLPAFEKNVEDFNKALEHARGLQRLLPAIIGKRLSPGYSQTLLTTAINDIQDGSETVLRLIELTKALAAAFPAGSKAISVAAWLDDWHFYAHLIYVAFVKAGGNRSRGRRGAAARFITKALVSLGYRHVTDASVETALARKPRQWNSLTNLI